MEINAVNNIVQWDIPSLTPVNVARRSRKKVAGLLSQGMMNNLFDEVEVLVPNIRRPADVFESAPDVLFIEAAPRFATRPWGSFFRQDAAQRYAMEALLRTARARSVPVVFWNTLDRVHRDTLPPPPAGIDVVVCDDPDWVALYRKAGIPAAALGAAVQPSLHHPFRIFAEKDWCVIPILVDAWADLRRFPEQAAVFERLARLGEMVICDSGGQADHAETSAFPVSAGTVRGVVKDHDLRAVLRQCRVSVFPERSARSRLTLRRQMMEHVCCGPSVLSLDREAMSDIPGIQVAASASDAEDRMRELLSGSMASARQALLGRREMWGGHTYSHRLATIFQMLGMQYDVDMTPKVTVITPTFRTDLLRRCIEQFDSQTWPNKELALAHNASETPTSIIDLCKSRSDLKVFTLPQEVGVGTCLNHAVRSSSGVYCIKMDDDDYYGRNYITDMVQYAMVIDADIFGKSPGYIYMKNVDATYRRDDKIFEHCVLTHDDIVQMKSYITGNTLSGKTDVFRRFPFSYTNFGCVDSVFHLSCSDPRLRICIFDQFNMIAYRGMDVDAHTWKIKDKQLIRSSSRLGPGIAVEDVLR